MHIILRLVLKTSSGLGNFSEEDCINNGNIKTRNHCQGKAHANPRRLPFFDYFLEVDFDGSWVAIHERQHVPLNSQTYQLYYDQSHFKNRYTDNLQLFVVKVIRLYWFRIFDYSGRFVGLRIFYITAQKRKIRSKQGMFFFRIRLHKYLK